MLSSRRGAPNSGEDEEDPASASAVTADADEPKTHPPATLAAYARSIVFLTTSSASSHCLAISLFVAFLFTLFGFCLLIRFSRPAFCDAPVDPLMARSAAFNAKMEGLASDFGSLGVPWCRTKQGKTVPWTQTDLLTALEQFIPIYSTRPIKNNMYGMGFDHSFGLWFITRFLNPNLVIESGAFKGHSTWVLRQAVPNARIISLSPRHPEKYLKKGPAYVDRNCTYFAGKDFVDFGSVEWKKVLKKHGVEDLSRVLVFFDDHQNELKRLKQALKAGFRHLIFEDNYDTGTGDHYSLRQICDQSYIRGGGHSCFKHSDEAIIRSKRHKLFEKSVNIDELCGKNEAWWGVRGYARDNFNHSNKYISHSEHFQNSRFVESVLDLYWELPPVAGPSLTHQTRFDPARSVEPIVADGRFGLFERIGLGKLDKMVFNGYTQMVYVMIS
ncbi:hypothetical protein LUZ60_001072 [Juncus effusus]|nr:hypothetical protein LUZ60_001072 [Juncus effusus]